MTQEDKGNTREFSFDIWETDWSDEMTDLLSSLIDEFDAYAEDAVGGTFKVSIVYVPNSEEENA